MSPRLARVLAFTIAWVALAGCVLTTSLADLTGAKRADVDAGALYSVGGTVRGLEGATITLAKNADESLMLTSDGPFRFTHPLMAGQDYIVTVLHVSDGRTCSVTKGEGQVVGADVTDVAIVCPSSITRLSGLSVSASALSPAFSPEVTAYSARFTPDLFALDVPVTITATVESPVATLTINGATATSGAPTVLEGLVEGPNTISVAVRAEARTTQTHTVVLTKQTQEAYIKASNTGGGNIFGTAIAVSADGNVLAVGAPGEESGATGINGNQNNASATSAGAVYVYRRSGATWRQEAYVKASNSRKNALLGTSIALSGDGSTLAVGAIGESSLATGIDGSQADAQALFAGAVYVFRRDGAAWHQEAYVKASNTRANHRFGNRVALSADGNTLVAIAPYEASIATGINGDQNDNSAPYAGAAYVYTRAGTKWTLDAYVKASNTRGNSNFGSGLSLSGDGSTLSIGADRESSAATSIDGNQSDTSADTAGAVYVFRRAAPSWKQEAYVKASSARAGAYFGAWTALSTDGSTLAVGAPSDTSGAKGIDGDAQDTSTRGSGAAFLFRRAGTAWTQRTYIKPSNTKEFTRFGVNLALSADGTRLAVASTGEPSAATGINGNANDATLVGAGAVYAFAASGTSWVQAAYIKASNTRMHSDFGQSTALSSDGHTLVISSDQESSKAEGIDGDQNDTTAAGAGAVYVFR